MRKVAIVIAVLLVVSVACAWRQESKQRYLERKGHKNTRPVLLGHKVKSRKARVAEEEADAEFFGFLTNLFGGGSSTTTPTTSTPSWTSSTPTTSSYGSKTYEVTGSGVRIRSTPCTSGSIVATVNAGTRMTSTGSSQSGCGYTWYSVSGSFGRGYIASSFVREVSGGSTTTPTRPVTTTPTFPTTTTPSTTSGWSWPWSTGSTTSTRPTTSTTSSTASKTYEVTGSGVRVRSSPCTTGNVVATLNAGTRMTSTGSSQSGCGYTWYSVSGSFGRGYIASSFVREVTGGSTTTPTRPVTTTPTFPTTTFPSSTGGCALMRFTHSRLTGSPCLIDVQFESTMRRLVQFAEQCRVKIHVTSAWRPNANVSGAIVTPATRSNHMSGHAIDFNLQSDSGAFCNSSCLKAQNNPTFTCFTNKIKSDSSMRWGISFNDPVHVDDALNIRSTSTWDQRYRATQEANRSGCAR